MNIAEVIKKRGSKLINSKEEVTPITETDTDIDSIKTRLSVINSRRSSGVSNAKRMSEYLASNDKDRFTEYRTLIEKSFDSELPDSDLQRLNQLRISLGKAIERVEDDAALLAKYLKAGEYQKVLSVIVDMIASTKRVLENALETFSKAKSVIQAMDMPGQIKLRKLSEIHQPKIMRLRQKIDSLESLRRITLANTRIDADTLKKHLGL